MRRREAREVLQLLHAERETGQRPRVFALRDTRFHLARVAEQLVAVAHARPGVQHLVRLVDAVEASLHQLDGRELLRADALREFVGGREVEFGRHGVLLLVQVARIYYERAGFGKRMIRSQSKEEPA